MATKTRLQAAADLLHQGRLVEARAKLLKELRLAPRSAAALELLGAVVFEMGRHDEAIEYLRRATHLAPSSPGPSLNLGKALLEAGLFHEAAATLKDTVGRWPEIPEGRFSYGNALLAQGERERAVEEYGAAIKLAPNHVGCYENLALVLSDLKEHDAACDVCERLLQLYPNSAVGRLLLAVNRRMLCNWDGHGALLASLAEVVEQRRAALGMAFASVMFWDNAERHRSCAELEGTLYSARKNIPPPPRLHPRKGSRIRVAYVSADFHRHATTWLIARLIERHDRNRFEATAISLGKDDDSAERHRLVKAFDRFLDMRESSTDAIVRTMRELEVDIAVDLKGYTNGSRPGIFLRRVAPIQVNYLGFPGTSGIAAMDYLIVDPFIAEGGLRQAATEKLAILPDCYQCNDDWVPMTDDPPSRSSCGLPDEAFVFCSFNHPEKLTPEIFDQWMRILRQIEGSVLWLLRPPGAGGAAIHREAKRRDVDPARIVLTDRVSHEQHLARCGVADLHLDTFPYNAHTTASDALRSGCPILTRLGTSFAARVCGSLLTAIGVPELIASSAEEYEAMAVRLARDKALLSELRQRIEQGRTHSPLFDSVRFCRNLERAYEAMVARSRAGLPPAEIDVRTLIGAEA